MTKLLGERRKYLENLKEGKQVDKEMEEQYFKNGIGEQHSLIAEDKYSMYMKRFVIHRDPNRAPLTHYSWSGTS